MQAFWKAISWGENFFLKLLMWFKLVMVELIKWQATKMYVWLFCLCRAVVGIPAENKGQASTNCRVQKDAFHLAKRDESAHKLENKSLKPLSGHLLPLFQVIYGCKKYSTLKSKKGLMFECIQCRTI